MVRLINRLTPSPKWNAAIEKREEKLSDVTLDVWEVREAAD